MFNRLKSFNFALFNYLMESIIGSMFSKASSNLMLLVFMFNLLSLITGKYCITITLFNFNTSYFVYSNTLLLIVNLFISLRWALYLYSILPVELLLILGLVEVSIVNFFSNVEHWIFYCLCYLYVILLVLFFYVGIIFSWKKNFNTNRNLIIYVIFTLLDAAAYWIRLVLRELTVNNFYKILFLIMFVINCWLLYNFIF